MLLGLAIIAAAALLVGFLLVNFATSPPGFYFGGAIMGAAAIGLIVLGVVELVRW